MTVHRPLDLDSEELSTCVGCGLCLPHCPTFRVSGEEGYSPRGRIDAMRAVEWRGAPVDDTFADFMHTCVQCRGCEPACPSGVPFGRLIEATKTALDGEGRGVPVHVRHGLRVLGHHRAVLGGSTALAVAQRLRVVPPRLGLPRLPLRRGAAVRPTGGDVWLFTGCVMDAWMRHTHRATAELIGVTGTTFAVPGRQGGCCGALQSHAGLHDDAVVRAMATMGSMPGTAPILVNSAGCGAAMKDFGHLLGTSAAGAFSARVFDVHEWLADVVDELPAPSGTRQKVIVQDPCHLRHVQRAHHSVRTVLGRVADIVELDDEGLCCGAGGAYSALQPVLSGAIRDRKIDAIIRASRASGATAVASANPGCLMHLATTGELAGAGVAVRHPVDIVAGALGLDPDR